MPLSPKFLWFLLVLFIFSSTQAQFLKTADSKQIRGQQSETLKIPTYPLFEAHNIAVAGYLPFSEYNSLAVENNLICYGTAGYLVLLDGTNPYNPIEKQRLYFPDFIEVLALKNKIAYVASRTDGLCLVDVSDPNQPQIIKTLPQISRAAAIAFRDDLLFVADPDSGLWILRQESELQIVSLYKPPSAVSDVEVSGNYAFLACGSTGIVTLDISDASNPTWVSSYDPDFFVLNISLSQNLLGFTSPIEGYGWVDVSDPANPVLVYSEILVRRVGITSDLLLEYPYAYLFNTGFGLRIMDISNPEQPTTVALWTDKMVTTLIRKSGNHLFLLQQYWGIWVVDVAKIEQPQTLSHINNGFEALDVAVSDNYAYVIDQLNGVYILDISNPAMIQIVSRVQKERLEHLCLSNNYLYAMNSNTLYVINVQDPLQPELLDSLQFGNITNLAVHGNYLFVTGDSLFIYDITNNLPELIGSLALDYPATQIHCEGNLAYLSTWHNLYVFDISIPSQPKLIANHQFEVQIRYFVVKNSFLYLSFFDGLRVYDGHDPQQLIQIGEYIFSIADQLAIDQYFLYVYELDRLELHLLNYKNPLYLEEMGYLKLSRVIRAIQPDSPRIFLAANSLGLVYLTWSDSLRQAVEQLNKGRKHLLHPAFPNPFNTRTLIPYQVLQATRVKLEIYNLMGQKIRTLLNSWLPAGTYQWSWDGRDDSGRLVASGVYVVTLVSEDFREAQKILLIR